MVISSAEEYLPFHDFTDFDEAVEHVRSINPIVADVFRKNRKHDHARGFSLLAANSLSPTLIKMMKPASTGGMIDNIIAAGVRLETDDLSDTDSDILDSFNTMLAGMSYGDSTFNAEYKIDSALAPERRLMYRQLYQDQISETVRDKLVRGERTLKILDIGAGPGSFHTFYLERLLEDFGEHAPEVEIFAVEPDASFLGHFNEKMEEMKSVYPNLEFHPINEMFTEFLTRPHEFPELDMAFMILCVDYMPRYINIDGYREDSLSVLMRTLRQLPGDSLRLFEVSTNPSVLKKFFPEFGSASEAYYLSLPIRSEKRVVPLNIRSDHDWGKYTKKNGLWIADSVVEANAADLFSGSDMGFVDMIVTALKAQVLGDPFRIRQIGKK